MVAAAHPANDCQRLNREPKSSRSNGSRMNFTDIVFFPFAVTVFLLFCLARNFPTTQVVILLAASLVFYGWWRVDFLLLLLYPTLIDYALGNAIAATASPFLRRTYLTLSIVSNLGLLAFFKYFNWLLDNVNNVYVAFGQPTFAPLNVLLPVGISFYTFQSMSYTIDIYRGDLKPSPSFLRYMLAVTAFPQLVAGPITRAREMLPQLFGNLASRTDFSGLWLILYGLTKKILIADQIALLIVDPVYGNYRASSAPELILATYAFAFQIFFDFSGYSDIAIGLGRIFGLRLPVNFRYPYLSSNPREFWSRWHITLSRWLRDYLYIPLGGSRGTRWQTMRNLMLTMLLGGAWHGAAWTFVIWGALHGLYLCIYHLAEPLFDKGYFGWWVRLPWAVRVFGYFNLTCLAWVFFRAQSFADAVGILSGMFTAGWAGTQITSAWLWLLLAAAFVHNAIEPRLDGLIDWFARRPAPVCALAYLLLFTVIGTYSSLQLSNRAFIYFQF
jgi:D-alanyl-lipoteichoic acid acyltransferase DltB (MBOAT superfamily)